MKRRMLSLVIAALMVITNFVNVLAYSDDRILTDPIENTYTGRVEATDMIRNANFIDIDTDYWAREAIARTVALNLVKGYDAEYRPDDPVTNQEAIAYAIRVIGQENEAQQAGVDLMATNPNLETVEDVWALGYLQLAQTAGIITLAQFNDALVEDQTTLDPAVNFVRGDNVTRDQAADWLVRIVETVNQTAFQLDNGTSQQSVYQYPDWKDIDPDKVQSVEKLSIAGIMKGNESGYFDPKGVLTRADMAQILRNMDSLYYQMNNITKKTGTVGAIVADNNNLTGDIKLSQNIYVRTSEGKVDVIKYEAADNSSPQPQTKDAVVYTEDEIGGLEILKENDEIEYLVNPADNIVLYVQRTKSDSKEIEIEGILNNVDIDNNTITITDKQGNKTTYKLMEGIIKKNDDSNSNGGGNNGDTTETKESTIYMDKHERVIKDLPTGSTLKLTIRNNIVILLNYIGEPELRSQIRGVVIDNNPDLGYITILDENRQELTKNYYQNSVKVEKQQYYDTIDEIGYIDSVFPNFEYDPRDSFIDEVEAGDVVFLTLDPTDSQLISEASVSTNYTMKYGKVQQIKQNDNYFSILMEYENKQTEWLDVPNDIFVSKDAYPANLADIIPGEWIKVLVNEAIVAPGYTIQSAKEVTIEGGERFVTGIYKAQLSNINPVQQQLVLKNVQSLNETGWSDYQQIKNISTNNSSGVEYYYNGNRVSLDFASQRLKNNYEVYVATQNAFGGEKAVMVSFRDSRDQLLGKDNIIYSDGNGNIGLTNKTDISTDNGTIVIRHGRLTNGINIMVPDYATISLNGENKAAVVKIEDTPNTSGLTIVRGRIKSIDEGKSFQVQSMAILSGTRWAYTPIERVFTIDYDTQFYDATGWVDQNTFIDYTDQTKVDKVYTIVTDGSKALQVVDNPYVKDGIRGTIYAVENNAGGDAAAATTVRLKDVYIYRYDEKTGEWASLSSKNSALNITIPANYIIAKDNKSVGISELKVGNQIRVMTDTLPEKPTEADTINGYITFVEK